ncbi:MAG: FkbM family methyltransferase [Bryobacterales bacterium]|nr:FkbM family methyltransferase [Bryobacterales bacterium]
MRARISILREDNVTGTELLRTPERDFWIKRGDGQAWSGDQLLAYLLAEHTTVGATNPDEMVRRGDIALDCGAHVGIFTHFALKRGAAKVVAIEPDPVNLECFRRNFEHEIADGRVVVVGKGVWSTPGKLLLRESDLNSGGNSVIGESSGPTVEIEVTTIDSLVVELHLASVNYIKMDIEGAEREALAGARETLRKYRPRLMLDAYHRPDDPVVLPEIIRQAYNGYQQVCGFCELDGRRLIPHALFFSP